jgi:hypothetical protein
MKLLTHLQNAFKRATEGAKNLAALDVDQQYAELDRRLEKERLAETERIRNAYPHGWFAMRTRSGETLCHWCPDCKTLSEGKIAKHCGSRKQEKRPEGLRLMFLPKTNPVLFV